MDKDRNPTPSDQGDEEQKNPEEMMEEMVEEEEEIMEQEEGIMEQEEGQQTDDLEGEGNGARQSQENDDGIIVNPFLDGLNHDDSIVAAVDTSHGISEEV